MKGHYSPKLGLVEETPRKCLVPHETNVIRGQLQYDK